VEEDVPKNHPYQKEKLLPVGFWRRLFGLRLPQNAAIEVNNLLAASERVADVKLEDIDQALKPYRMDIAARLPEETRALFGKFVKHVLADMALSDEEAGDMVHLKLLLGMTDSEARDIFNKAAGRIYKAGVDSALADGRVTDEEWAQLDALRDRLGITDDLARSIYTSEAHKFVQNAWEKAISDQQLSPEEDEELVAITKSLGVSLQMDKGTRVTLDKYRFFWQIANGDVPTIDPGINLQKKEVCYFATEAEWFEPRTIRKRIRYAGPTARIRIAKGIYWRMGDLALQPVTEDIMAPIDEGRLFLTNKRLIFLGSRGNKSIRLQKILDFTPYQNGIDLQKDAGKSPFLQFSFNVDVFAALLGRAIADLQ
jgi:hypothetical protein